MNADIKLGRILGIPVGLNASWFLVFILVTWSLASGYFPLAYPQLPAAAYWVAGVLTSLLFFGSVLAHEFGHSVIALRNNIPVHSITLFLFGGVAQLEREPRSPGAEFRIAIAGPLVSLGLALFFQAIWLLDQSIPFLAAPSEYLARINLLLAVFNLIPGFPLDGGRVLRAIVWKFTGSFSRATRVAAFTGQLAAFGFIGVGVISAVSGNLMNGLWLAFIGWFLRNAAATTSERIDIQDKLRGIKVSQVMQRDCMYVPGLTPISTLVSEQILEGGGRCFFVSDEGQLRGMLTLNEINAVPRPHWRYTTIDKVMVPFEKLSSVEAGSELMAAMQTMDKDSLAQLMVVDAGRIVGFLSREGIMNYLRTRAELGI